MLPDNPLRHRLGLRFTAFLVTAMAALGLLNLAGWAAELEFLRTLGAGPETMKANTALAFVSAALCLAMLLRPSPSGVARFALLVTASVPFLLGTLTLAQYVLGLDLGLDQALFADPHAISPPAGRMAPNTAVSFSVAGLALLVRTLSPGQILTRKIILACALAVLGLAALSLIGHVTQISAGRQWGQATLMTLPATTGLALLGAALIGLLRVDGDLRWYLSPRQTLALSTGVFALFGIAEISWEAMARLQETNRQLAQVAETRYLLSEILSAAQDQESGFRRYWLAGELAARREATAARARELQDRLHPRLERREDHDSLHAITVLQARLTSFDERLRDTYDDAGLPAAIDLIKTGEGLRTMEDIRLRVTSLQEGQAIKLARLDTEARRWRRTTALALPAGGLLALVAIGVSLSSLNTEAGRRRASETRFRGIFDSTFQFIGLLTPDGIVLEANQTALDFGGLRADAVINRPFWEAPWWRLRPEIQQRLQIAIARAAAGELVRYEEDVLGAGGRVATIDFSLKPVRDDNGTIVYLVPEGRDITESKQAARALSESEARWNFALTGSDLGVWDWNATTNEVFFSDRWSTMLGYEPGEISHRLEEWSSRVHPDDMPRVMKLIRDHFEQRTASYVSEHRIRAKDGSWRWIMDRGQAIERAPDGRPLRVIGTHTDITSQKNAEQDARRLQDQLAGILRFSPNLITLLDLEGRYLLVGHRAAEALGRPAHEMTGRHVNEVLPQAAAAAFRERLARMNASPVPFEVEDDIPTPTGERVFQTQLFPLHDAEGRHYATGGIARDITDSRQALATVKNALAEREVLLREIHHRVKNNLQIVSSLLSLQARALPDPAHRSPFEECRRRIASMSLIHDQLYRHGDLARIDFAGYVETLVRLQRAATGLTPARVAVSVEVTVPPIDIATAVPCGLIVNELFSNTCKHAFPGGRAGKVSIGLIERGAVWELFVRDDGVGSAAPAPEKGGGLGRQLIEALARQLRGDIQSTASASGHQTVIRFPAPASHLSAPPFAS